MISVSTSPRPVEERARRVIEVDGEVIDPGFSEDGPVVFDSSPGASFLPLRRGRAGQTERHPAAFSPHQAPARPEYALARTPPRWPPSACRGVGEIPGSRRLSIRRTGAAMPGSPWICMWMAVASPPRNRCNRVILRVLGTRWPGRAAGSAGRTREVRCGAFKASSISSS